MDVIEAMNLGVRSARLGVAIFYDCSFLSNDSAKISFVHCAREATTVARELARMPKFYPPSVWLEEPPNSIIIPLLLKDVPIPDYE